MQARYHWHPTRHKEVSEFFSSVRDRGRANNTLLHLSDALVRSSLLNASQMVHIGVADDEEFKVHRIRLSEKKYPDLFRLYKSSPSRLRSFILGEVLAEAARFRKSRPQEAGLLLLNAAADLEDVGEDAYPEIGAEPAPENPQVEVEAPQHKVGESSDGDQVNGLGATLLSAISETY